MPVGMPAVTDAADWLRRRDDDGLVSLLRARPDLTVPAPSDLEVLGRRLDNPTSIHRVLEGLNALAVRVLAGLAVLDAGTAAVPPKTVTALFPATRRAAVTAALTDLEALALVRSADDGALTVPAAVLLALGPYPAGLGPPGGLDTAAVGAALAALEPAERGMLERLDRNSPRGVVHPDSPAAPAVSALVKAGLLVRLDSAAVELPREVGLALRGSAPLGEIPVAPAPPTARPDVGRVDGTAAGQALTTLQLLERAIGVLGHQPAVCLKSGGVGVRELRRVTKELGVQEHRAALILELLAANGLITAVAVRSGSSWQPTTTADEFLSQDDETAWTQAAGWWIDLRRDPSRVGDRDDAGKTMAVLAPELSWTRGPADRRFVLTALAALRPGSGLDDDALAATLAWSAPLRTALRRETLQRSTITEGTWLGVLAFGSLSTAGRRLLAGDPAGATAAVAAALPAPVDTVLIQADLTIVAPGRLAPALQARLEQVAEIESSGSATVYRVTPPSLRRALSAGRSAADLHELFAAHSATPVPQALTYLVDDTARRHGVLRIGGTASYLRSDDPALVAEAVRVAETAGFVLRRIAPTVAIGSADLPDLLETLSDNGIGVTAEDVGGSLVDLRPVPKRSRPAQVRNQRWREPPVPSGDQLTALVARMRSSDAARAAGEGRKQTSAEAVAVLRESVADRAPVWIGYVDAEGGTSRRVIEPVVVSGGMVVAYDRLRSSMRTFALHRITEAEADIADTPRLTPPR